jgi:hypothetical protein
MYQGLELNKNLGFTSTECMQDASEENPVGKEQRKVRGVF